MVSLSPGRPGALPEAVNVRLPRCLGGADADELLSLGIHVGCPAGGRSATTRCSALPAGRGDPRWPSKAPTLHSDGHLSMPLITSSCCLVSTAAALPSSHPPVGHQRAARLAVRAQRLALTDTLTGLANPDSAQRTGSSTPGPDERTTARSGPNVSVTSTVRPSTTLSPPVANALAGRGSLAGSVGHPAKDSTVARRGWDEGSWSSRRARAIRRRSLSCRFGCLPWLRQPFHLARLPPSRFVSIGIVVIATTSAGARTTSTRGGLSHLYFGPRTSCRDITRSSSTTSCERIVPTASLTSAKLCCQALA